MNIICVSRGGFVGGSKLAQSLARKLGCPCISREEIGDAAAKAGIALGKLEMAVLNRRPLNEWLNIEKERFRALVSATLSEKAMEGSVVYHGRQAHILLAGVHHVMRIRTIMDLEMRIELTMQRLGISREKAQRYIEQVDDDRSRWARTLYSSDWTDPRHYDLVVNLSSVSAENAASALLGMSDLPEFQATPASRRVLQDINLGARCRLAIADDPRTRMADVTVKAHAGHVLVTYLPRQQQFASFLPDILRGLAGVEEVVCTMASTNLLWIEERHRPDSPALSQILDIASRWNASVELVRMAETGSLESEPGADADAALGETAQQAADRAGHGGILDELAVVEDARTDEETREVIARLIASGRAGGYRQVVGGPKPLLDSFESTASHSLVVVGEVFLSRPGSVRKRLVRDLISQLTTRLRYPVIGVEELATQYAFGPRQWVRLAVFGALSALTCLLVFSNDTAILEFLTRPGTLNRAISAAALFLFTPLFAYLYGNFSRRVLQLLRFE